MAADKNKKTDEMEDLFAAPSDDDNLFAGIEESTESPEVEAIDFDIPSGDAGEVSIEEVSDIGGDDSAPVIEDVDASEMGGGGVMDDYVAPSEAESDEDAPPAVEILKPGKAAKGGKGAARGALDKKKIAIIAGAAVGGVAILGGAALFFLGGSEPAPKPKPAASVAKEAPQPATDVAAVAATAPVATTTPTIPVPAAAAPAPALAKPVPPPAKPVPPPPAPKQQKTSVARGGAPSKVVGVEFFVSGDKEMVRISTDGDATGRFKSFGLSQPERIVVDIKGVSKGFPGYKVGAAQSKWIDTIRSAEHPGRVRVVIDFKGSAPKHSILAEGNDIIVTLR